MILLKCGLSSVGLLLLLTSCNNNPPDPVGEPYRLKFQVNQTSTASSATNLSLLVSYGGFGLIPATVEFLDGTTVIATLIEGDILKPTNLEPWDKNFQKDVAFKAGIDYNLSAKISWTHKGVKKSLTSDVVKFRLATP